VDLRLAAFSMDWHFGTDGESNGMKSRPLDGLKWDALRLCKNLPPTSLTWTVDRA
jgi:hypothetical protein